MSSICQQRERRAASLNTFFPCHPSQRQTCHVDQIFFPFLPSLFAIPVLGRNASARSDIYSPARARRRVFAVPSLPPPWLTEHGQMDGQGRRPDCPETDWLCSTSSVYFEPERVCNRRRGTHGAGAPWPVGWSALERRKKKHVCKSGPKR